MIELLSRESLVEVRWQVIEVGTAAAGAFTIVADDAQRIIAGGVGVCVPLQRREFALIETLRDGQLDMRDGSCAFRQPCGGSACAMSTTLNPPRLACVRGRIARNESRLWR
jgi:hypothetical protein